MLNKGALNDFSVMDILQPSMMHFGLIQNTSYQRI